MKKQKSPLGNQSFRNIRESNCYYVDKTPLIERLISEGDPYFLSRPRRFGKSLLIDTIQCLFQGEESLFKGLYIHDRWNFLDKYPVIRISFEVGEFYSRWGIERQVHRQINRYINQFDLSEYLPLTPEIPPEYDHGNRESLDKDNEEYNHLEQNQILFPDAPGRLTDLIHYMNLATNKQVVILVDEYDKPVLDVIQNKTQAKIHRNYLRALYGAFKKEQGSIKFLLVTGISVSSKANLLSGVNNLIDITLNPDYSAICGYTEKELKDVFAAELKKIHLEKIRKWYNGYCWDLTGKGERVFCPHSVLRLFNMGLYRNWWFQDSVPTHLYDFLEEQNVTSIDITERWVRDSSLAHFDTDSMDLNSLLFQNGYLSIRKVDADNSGLCLLGYPNIEVQKSFAEGYIKHMIGGEKMDDLALERKSIVTLLAKRDIEGFRARLEGLMVDIPSHWHKKHGKMKVKLSDYEAWYAVYMFGLFSDIKVEVCFEKVTNLGRSDMVVVVSGQAFVFEFKCVRSKNVDLSKVTEKAFGQILGRSYEAKYGNRGLDCYMVAMIFWDQPHIVWSW